MVGKGFEPTDYERLFQSLRNLVDEAEEAYESGNPTLARHAAANLTFASQMILGSLKESEPAYRR